MTDDLREELADWLGAQDFARNVRDHTDEETTIVDVDVLTLTDAILASPILERIKARSASEGLVASLREQAAASRKAWVDWGDVNDVLAAEALEARADRLSASAAPREETP